MLSPDESGSYISIELAEVAYRALVGGGGEHGVGLERRGDLAIAGGGGLPGVYAFRLHGCAALGERLVAELDVDGAVGDIDLDDVPLLHQADGTAGGRLGRDVADGESGGAAGEAPVGEQRARLAEPLRLQVGGRVEHLLHARPAAGALVADDDDIVLLHLALE